MVRHVTSRHVTSRHVTSRHVGLLLPPALGVSVADPDPDAGPARDDLVTEVEVVRWL